MPLALFGLCGPAEARYLASVHSGLRSNPDDWSDPRHQHGLEAERQAIAFLVARGWEIAAHRFRAGRGEIDLVVRKGRLVAFVEVKARRGDAFGSPLEAVTGPKRRDLVRVARAWMDRHARPGDVFRFDCIGVQGETLEHVEDAFRPGWR